MSESSENRLTALLNDPTVSRVRVLGHAVVLAQREGRWQRMPRMFGDSEALLAWLDRFCEQSGAEVERSGSGIDGWFPDRWRLRATLAPTAVDGPMLLFQRLSETLLDVEQLLERRFLAPEMLLLLEAAVRGRLNVVVSGGADAGKTTLLSALGSFIPLEQRLVLIEDRPELTLPHTNLMRLASRPSAEESVVLAATLLADRIVLGDCRAGAAAELIRALNQAHRGSLTALRARDPDSALAWLERRLLLAEAKPNPRQVRERIASAVQLVVQVDSLPGPIRKVRSIAEVTGVEGDRIGTRELFRYEPLGMDQHGSMFGQFVALGARPDFLPRLEQMGISLPPAFFTARVLQRDGTVRDPSEDPLRATSASTRKPAVNSGWLQRLLSRRNRPED